uniref:HDC11626 n=1 Tax=Drosophila melanogaster TaxID=7227 RepID=Q6IKR8_DROME|nr:TPA_inf: HDC11626 [Drosophila melanogaster]
MGVLSFYVPTTERPMWARKKPSREISSLQEGTSYLVEPSKPILSFQPYRRPHMGCLWEAGVKSFKIHFYKTTELSTLLFRIKACLNYRPISEMPEDPSDNLALTLGNFLIAVPDEPPITGEASSIQNRWQRLLQRRHSAIV